MTILIVFLTTIYFILFSIYHYSCKLRYVSFFIKLLLDWIGLDLSLLVDGYYKNMHCVHCMACTK